MFTTVLGTLLAIEVTAVLLGLLGLGMVMYRDRRKGRIYWFLSGLFFSMMAFWGIVTLAGSEIPVEARTVRWRWLMLEGVFVLLVGVSSAVLHIIFGLWQEEVEDRTQEAGELPESRWIANITKIVTDVLKSELKPTAAQLERIEARIERSIEKGKTGGLTLPKF